MNIFKFEHEDDKYARHPMDLKYMKTIRSLLRVISCWPYHVFGEKYKALPLRNTYTLFLGRLGLVVGCIVYIHDNFGTTSFLELGESYITVFFSVVGMQRYSIPWFKSYDEAMKEFILEIHMIHHRHKTEYSEYIYRYINKISAILVKLLRTEAFFAVAFYCIMPVYSNFKRGMYSRGKPPDEEFVHSLKYNIPFINYRTNFFGYLVMAIINVIISHDLISCVFGFDLLLCIIVFHILGHLKILDHNLRTLPKPSEMRNRPYLSEDVLTYTKEENEKIAEILKDIVNHHRIIRKFMAKVSDAFGPMLVVYLLFHQASGCIFLLECSNLDSQALVRYANATVTIFQLLIEITIIMELLCSQSETLKDAVYSVPWECMNTSNRKMVLFIHMNVQEPISLKAMGIVSVGVQTMATILKTSFSYFMFLRTLH